MNNTLTTPRGHLPLSAHALTSAPALRGSRPLIVTGRRQMHMEGSRQQLSIAGGRPQMAINNNTRQLSLGSGNIKPRGGEETKAKEVNSAVTDQVVKSLNSDAFKKHLDTILDAVRRAKKIEEITGAQKQQQLLRKPPWTLRETTENGTKEQIMNSQKPSLTNEQTVPLEKSFKACAFFLKGRCRYGADCKFVHANEFETGPPQVPVCKFFLQDNCKFKSGCMFSHEKFEGRPRLPRFAMIPQALPSLLGKRVKPPPSTPKPPTKKARRLYGTEFCGADKKKVDLTELFNAE